MSSNKVDPGEFVDSLKHLTLGEVHPAIDKVHSEFVSQKEGSETSIHQAMTRLSSICGREVVAEALKRVQRGDRRTSNNAGATASSGVTSHSLPGLRASSISGANVEATPMAGATTPGNFGGRIIKQEDAAVQGEQLQSPPEISRAALSAWNHALECPHLSKISNASDSEQQQQQGHCEFYLCDQVRPSVLHRIKTRKKGIMGKCLEGCKHCGFYLRMREATSEQGEQSKKARKFEEKKKKLIQLFAGLLLAHQGQGSDTMMALYHHVMSCEQFWPVQETSTSRSTPSLRKGCPYRNANGSCRSSMTLLGHFRSCSRTKQCAICSSLPPKLRRLNKTKKATPLPVAIAKVEAREKLQRSSSRSRGVKRHDRTAGSESTSNNVVDETNANDPMSANVQDSSGKLGSSDDVKMDTSDEIAQPDQFRFDGMDLMVENDTDPFGEVRPMKRIREGNAAASDFFAMEQSWSEGQDAVNSYMGSPESASDDHIQQFG